MTWSGSSGLRGALVGELRELKLIEADAVAEAFLHVPREAFVPQVRLETLYHNVAIPTKFNARGEAISSSSEPGIMAQMLEMLCIEPGQNVLEVGAGTGYNAALLQELIGTQGRVTSIEYRPDVAAMARGHLEQAGYSGVTVVTGDGALGHHERAPFDRIIATASCQDVPLAWWEQLKPGGLLVLPMSRPSLRAVFALVRTEDGFEANRATPGYFMPMPGRDRTVPPAAIHRPTTGSWRCHRSPPVSSRSRSAGHSTRLGLSRGPA